MGDLLSRAGLHFRDVAVVGLGTGALACYAESGKPVDVLRDRSAGRAHRAQRVRCSRSFPTARGRIAIVIGDGRKGIEAAAPGSYDLIVLDAFSSDAVPAHLLTAEAIDAYLLRLRPGGIVALHISNRYLDMEPVIGRLACRTTGCRP